MTTPAWLQRSIRGVLLDVSGVLKDGEIAIPGSVEAVGKLHKAKIPFCIASNESTATPDKLFDKLTSMGFNILRNKILTPIPAVKDIVRENHLRPYLLVQKSVVSEFTEFDQSSPNCVIIGDAEENFTYDNLNLCFRTLMKMEKPVFYTLGVGKYYQGEDGLILDVGGYTKALEYATGIEAIPVGKPKKEYFYKALGMLSLPPEDVVMVGDDIDFDIGGCQQAGIRGILVKTGKWRPWNDNHPTVKPDAVVADLAEAIELILRYNSQSGK